MLFKQQWFWQSRPGLSWLLGCLAAGRGVSFGALHGGRWGQSRTGLSWGLWGVHPSQLALEGLVELCMAPRGIRQKRVRGVTVRAQGPGPPTGVKNTAGAERSRRAGRTTYVQGGHWVMGMAAGSAWAGGGGVLKCRTQRQEVREGTV